MKQISFHVIKFDANNDVNIFLEKVLFWKEIEL